MTRPDFLILGAMKSGTSTLAAQLGEQNGIFMTTPKEPNFFSDDEVFARGQSWYSSLFDGAADADLKGEASTHYTKLPTYPNTILRARIMLQAPRLIYIIRNPIERAVSHFLHEWSLGRVSGDIEFELANRAEMVDYGRYSMQIKPWIEAFGAEAVHLTSLEAMQSDPQRVLSEVAAFIGYTGKVVWIDAHAQENASAERMRRFPFQNLLIDNPVAESLRRALVPQGLRERIKRARQMRERPHLPGELRGELEKTFFEDYVELTSLFPNHPDLRASYPFLAT